MNEFFRRAVSAGTVVTLACDGPWTRLFRIDGFRFFYAVDTSAAAPADLTATHRNDVPDYILRLAASFVRAHRIYVSQLSLADPLTAGRFHRQGARHIDLFLDDIPAQRGLVSGTAAAVEGCTGGNGSRMEKAVRIRIHRELILNSATPIHELFHVFQYAYAPFTNAWFMEGLARWSQNLIQQRKMTDERLPQTAAELDALLVRAHDAEYFWRRLFSFSGGGEALIRPLLEAVAAEADTLELHGGDTFRWDKKHKGAYGNNAVLLRALVTTLKSECPQPGDTEMQTFLTLCSGVHHRDAPPGEEVLQHFFQVLQKVRPDAVTTFEGRLVCDCFDPDARRLVVETLDVSTLDRFELDALNVIESLEGKLILRASMLEELNGFNYLRHVSSLRIEEMPNLSVIRGFNALESVGELIIRQNGVLHHIDGFNILFGESHGIPGAVRITNNPKLSSVWFLRGLKQTGSSFYLHHNALETLEGLESLEAVGASLSLSSNRLTSLASLSNLTEVGGMVGLAYNRLHSLKGLENLRRVKTVAWNGDRRTLALQGNPALSDIRAISGLTGSDGKLIVLTDGRAYRSRPAWSAPAFSQTVTLLDGKGRNRRNKCEFFDMEGAPMRVLFSKMGAGWTDALKRCTWLDAHFLEFSAADTVLDYCLGQGIDLLLPIGIPAQLFAARHIDRLRDAGLHLLVSKEETFRLFKDKKRFYDYMSGHGWKAYMPERFEAGETKRFPLIIKPRVGSGGKGSRIVRKESEITDADRTSVMEAYIPSSEEYATNIMFNGGRTLGHVTYRKKAAREEYILGQGEEDQHHIVNEVCETPFLSLFESILKDADFTGICCVDYKIDNGQPKIFEINARLGFTLATMPEDLERMLTLYRTASEADRIPKILFGHNWQKATGQCSWLEAHHLRPSDPDELISYCAGHGISVLFGNNYGMQKWISRHASLLQLNGLHFIVNTQETRDLLVNKERFDARMREAGFAANVPDVYPSAATAKYPCVVKPPSGGAGRGIFIAENPESAERAGKQVLLTEYLPGADEYATSIFYKNGRILHHRTYRKRAVREPYILQQENEVHVEACETLHLPLFTRMVEALSGFRGYCLCSLNYKIVDGVPKLFEINPRTGYTLAQHPEDFREFMQIYLYEATR